ncbi:MAG: hypothetical protein ACE5JB_05605, partial [bacterium]
MKFKSSFLFLFAQVFLLAPFSFGQGSLAPVTVTPVNSTEAGAISIYRFQFTIPASDSLPPDGKIIINFEQSGFDLSTVALASSDNSNLTGDFSTVNGSGSTITLVRDGTGNNIKGADTPVSISVANVTNNQNAGSSYTVNIRTTKADDTPISGPTTSSTFTIIPGALGSFTLSGVPSSVTAGGSFGSNDVTVTAKDIYGNTKTNYTGTVSWSSSDGSATLPADYQFTGGDNGTHTFSGTGFTLQTAGGQTITVTDGSVSATSGTIEVGVGSLSDFTLSAGATQTAGVGFSLSVSGAVDGSSNAWSGTVVVSVFSGGGDSPNGTAPSLSNITVSNGSGSASQVLVNAVSTVLQGSADGVSKTTGSITMDPGSLGSFTLSGVPSSVTAGG